MCAYRLKKRLLVPAQYLTVLKPRHVDTVCRNSQNTETLFLLLYTRIIKTGRRRVMGVTR